MGTRIYNFFKFGARDAFRIALVAVCILLYIHGSAQTAGSITLPKEPIETINTISNPKDTARILAILRRGIYLEYKKPDSSMLLLTNALQESQFAGFSYGIAMAFMNIGNIYYNRGNYDSGVYFTKQAYPYCELAAKYNNRYDLIIRYLIVIGNLYRVKGDFQLTAYYYYQALQKIYLINNHKLISQLYSAIGSLWINREQYEVGLMYTKQALFIAEAYGHNTNDYLPRIYGDLGAAYIGMKDSVNGLYFLNKSIESCKLFEDYGTMAVIYANLGVYYSERDTKKALAYFYKAKDISGNVDMANATVKPYLGIGWCYYLLKDYKNAAKYLEITLQMAKRSGLKYNLSKSYLAMARTSAAIGDYKAAYNYLDSYTNINDSLVNEKSNVAIRKLDIKYRSVQKDQAIAQQENHLREKNIWIGGISIGSFLLITSLIALYRSNRNKQRLQTTRIHALQQEQEISAHKQEILQLKAMIDGEEKERARIARELHDGIGGMLASIKLNLSAAKKQHPELGTFKKIEDITHMLEDTSVEVRKTAHNLIPDILIHHSLPEALTMYCDSVSANGSLQINLQLHQFTVQLNKSVELMLYRMVQELIQNIIKHAQATIAEIQIMQYDDVLSITVEDNGVGFDTQESNGGFGLQNLRFRVQTLQGYISIQSTKGESTTIHIEFNLEKLKDI